MFFMKRSLLSLTALLFVPASSFAEQPFSDEQKKAFSEEFRMSHDRMMKGAASKNELEVLLDAQNARVALPANVDDYKNYLKNNDLMKAVKKRAVPQLGTLMMWNLNALDMTAIDHTLLGGNDGDGHEQFGPHRTSRVLGIVHLAIFEAVNSVYDKFETYHDLQTKIVNELRKTHPEVSQGKLSDAIVSVDAAIVEAAHDTLLALYPKKKPFLDFAESVSLQELGPQNDKYKLGYDLGKAAAKIVLEERGFDSVKTAATNISTFNDGSSEPEPLASDPRYAGDGPDRWHPDPIHPLTNTALGGNWMHVRPFVLSSANAHRPTSEPAKTSLRFITSYKDVKNLGGDDSQNLQAPRGTTPTRRSKDQLTIGNFWAYDGTALLCAPPRLYNEVATSIALKEKPIKSVIDMARYLALVNVTMADAGISAWDAKYAFRLGRPVTYIRSQSVDTTADGSAISSWTPIGAPVSNGTLDARNLTPPFPSFPSGHAVFGGALFQTLRLYYDTNGSNEKFSFMSDEYNGKNYDAGAAKPRDAVNKSFKNFSEAEKENARSRIYLGIHWQFDADVGVAQGHEVAMHVFNNAFRPKAPLELSER